MLERTFNTHYMASSIQMNSLSSQRNLQTDRRKLKKRHSCILNWYTSIAKQLNIQKH